MFEIVLSFCLQFYERGSNKALYRLVLLPPRITKLAQTFRITKKILFKMYLKIQLDPARKANSHRQHQSSQTLSISEEKTSEKRLFTTKVNTKKNNPKMKSLLWQMFAKSNHSDWVKQGKLRGQLAVISQIRICHTFIGTFTFSSVYSSSGCLCS